ncbi:MAG: endonuclease III [Rickettsiales bacterium]|jgi:endonuclease-3|nr:endonuclease III [Rickettsiales bacterium]
MKTNYEIILSELEKCYGKTDLTELEYENNYTLLIATLLSAQSTDKKVNEVTKKLFKVANTPQKMVELGEDELKKYVKTINYYITKSKNIIKLSRELIDKFDGNVPNTREYLEVLPGIGRKTANIVLNIAFKCPNIAVDTHVFRVSNRLGIVNAKNVKECEEQLLKITPKKYISLINNWFVLFGRYICKAKNPSCNECFLLKNCLFKK